jgi:hypothetical protein
MLKRRGEQFGSNGGDLIPFSVDKKTEREREREINERKEKKAETLMGERRGNEMRNTSEPESLDLVFRFLQQFVDLDDFRIVDLLP